MNDTLDKLTRGTQLLSDAEGDPDLLGVALLALQGALNQQLRSMLEGNPSLSATDRDLLKAPAIPTGQLIEICRRYGDLDREQAWRIIEAERLRVAFARGEPFRGSPSEIRGYGRFVAELCGRTDVAQQLAAIPTARLAAPTDDEEPDDDADPEPSGPYYTIMRWIPGMLLAAVLAGGAWLLLGRAADNSPQPITTRPASTALPDGQDRVATLSPDAAIDATMGPIVVAQGTPTALPSPTAAASQGRIVRLGGGPGWLHDAPTFNSPTLPIRLSEGQIVAILGPQQTDPEGTLWVYVATGGYEGWSPQNNVEEAR
jgi:hypothetical protein